MIRRLPISTLFPYTTLFRSYPGPTTMDYLTQHTSMPASPVRQADPSLPQSLEALLTWTLTKDPAQRPQTARELLKEDRKSTRLNSSHQIISYAVFCLKIKRIKQPHPMPGPPWRRNASATFARPPNCSSTQSPAVRHPDHPRQPHTQSGGATGKPHHAA